MALGNRKSRGMAVLTLLLSMSAMLEPCFGQQSSEKKPSLSGPAAPAAGRTSPPQASRAAAARLSGTVTDAGGVRKIEDAHVVLSNSADAKKRFETRTEADGTFSFDGIEPGNWTLTVSAKDMLAHSDKIILKSGEAKSMNFALEDLEAVDIMRITGKRTLVHPDKIGSETNLDHKFIYQYKTGNDLKELLSSTPGIMHDSFGNLITRGEHNAINYEIDGVVIPEAAGVLQQTQFISPRSLQTMKVDIGGYEASDGGGPLGAVAHMKSLPILSKPNFNIGTQGGGPLAGNIYYNASTAFSQDPASAWNRLRVESSGSFRGLDYRLAPPVKNYVNNWGADINTFTKLEYMASEHDTFRLTMAFNDTFAQLPESKGSRAAGYHGSQSDAQNYVIASYFRKSHKYFDELNLHVLNGFYSEKFHTSMNFDPYPNFNGEQPLLTLGCKAKRSNYIFSAQGAISKAVARTHHFKLGFLSEVRPERTNFNAVYFNGDAVAGLQQANSFPYGALTSPFTGQAGGPQFLGNAGRFHGFRYLQSAYFQDKFTPQKGVWKRLTLDAGLRFDMQKSYYGNLLPLYQTIASVPGITPFSIQPYLAQHKTDAQVSGRYGASFALARNTVLRGSYSELFMPTSGDYFVTPYQVVNLEPTNGVFAYGVYDGTPRPLHATRGRLVDTSIERQFGPRCSTRTNLFYKYLTNFGDSGVVGNLPLYNRLTNSAQDAYGIESRLDLKSAKDGYGFNGFLSNTVQVAYLRGTKTPSGGFFENPTEPTRKFPDHDRRLSTVAGVGYKAHRNCWVLVTCQLLSGVQDGRDILVFGPHRARTPFVTDLSLSAGYQTSRKLRQKCAYLPSSFDLRIENLLNQRVPLNLGSPFQGTRYNLPLRVLVGCSWQLGEPEAKISASPSAGSIKTLSQMWKPAAPGGAQVPLI
jgi:hypothetical protein